MHYFFSRLLKGEFQNTAVLNGHNILFSLGRNHWSMEHGTGASKKN